MPKDQRQRIYLDNAATSLYKPASVGEAMVFALGHLGNAGRGSHEASLDTDRLFVETRRLLKDMFGAASYKRVAFTSGATESLNLLIQGFFKPGDHVITTVMEHNSVLRPLYRLEAEGVIELSIIGLDKNGALNVADAEAAYKENTKALIMVHAANLNGRVNDLTFWGNWARDKGIRFFVDAAQSAGTLPINMAEMNIDALALTGHKALMGPQGTGALIIGKDFELEPLKVGGSGIMTFSKEHPQKMPTRLEAGTLNSPGIAGLKAGLEHVVELGIEAISAHEEALRLHMIEGIKEIQGIKYYGSLEGPSSAIVSINVGELDSALVGMRLQEEFGIIIRSGGHCAPLYHKALGTAEQGVVRFSFSYGNTEEEVDAALEAISKISST